MSNNQNTAFLVSVGIPTYNRPDGLERTLQQISIQTYKNLEIIISDNCSENPDVKKIALKFCSNDSRVQYFRQETNIGAGNNFKVVLEKAKGEYFMWAADDDEWDPLFIETCLKNIGDAGACMQHSYKTIVRETGRVILYDLPVLSSRKSVFENVISFFSSVRPSLFYGLFRRQTIMQFLDDQEFDIYDVFFLTRYILTHGFNTFPEQLYTAGIDGSDYNFKPMIKKKGRLFSYKPLLLKTISEILKCRKLSFIEKHIVAKFFFFKVLMYFINYEKKYRPNQVKVVRFLLRAIIYIDVRISKVFKIHNYYIVK